MAYSHSSAHLCMCKCLCYNLLCARDSVDLFGLSLEVVEDAFPQSREEVQLALHQ